MASDSTTIHWHGFTQDETPYMDGVPYVTQCPILPGTTFRYEFFASNEGTHFWHAHIGLLTNFNYTIKSYKTFHRYAKR